jgi:hypothetical protein
MLATGFLMFGVIGSASATIININAYTNTESNPVSMIFSAGTYAVSAIGVTDGGMYNSWNAWGGAVQGCDSDGANCLYGWINNYAYSSTEFGTIASSDGIKYANSSLALDNALDTMFTLSSDTYVNFFILDSIYRDNIGGMSLNVTKTQTPVPEPTTMLLFGTGLAGLAGSRLRRKKK